jgi:hypothetical protein
MGETAARILLQRMQGFKDHSEAFAVAPELIIRETTAPPNYRLAGAPINSSQPIDRAAQPLLANCISPFFPARSRCDGVRVPAPRFRFDTRVCSKNPCNSSRRFARKDFPGRPGIDRREIIHYISIAAVAAAFPVSASGPSPVHE